jgi:hypothetical protein
MKRLTLFAALLLSCVPPAAAKPAKPPVDPASYPALDDQQLGHVNAIVRLAGQSDSDWSGMGSSEPGQGYFDAYRYQLAMMSYTLSLASYRYTPAYRALYRDTDAKLIHKMMLFDVWGFWELTSRGAKAFDPSLTALGEGWIDPVKDQNIMYSGHLFQMVTTHQMLYGDMRYAQPGALTFTYNPVGRGMGKQSFPYDTHSLAKVLADQFQENGWKGIECEPNAIFPECNQHPLLGFALYDRANGTDYFKRISAAYKQQFDALNFVDPKTRSFAAFYMVKQGVTLQNPAAWADGWAGTFMHAWYKPQVEEIYPVQKANLIVRLPDGTMTPKNKGENDHYSHDHGFFAVLAGEVGDSDTRNRLLAYADRYWSPRWEGRALVYARHDGFKHPGDGADVWRRVQPLTGNGLIGLARMTSRDGFYNLFNKPFDAAHFRQPYLADISYPAAQVRRAIYDPVRRALVFTLAPDRGAAPQPASWTIGNLDAKKSYRIWRDGEAVATVKAGLVQPGAAIDLAATPDGLRGTMTIAADTSIVVAEQ